VQKYPAQKQVSLSTLNPQLLLTLDYSAVTLTSTARDSQVGLLSPPRITRSMQQITRHNAPIIQHRHATHFHPATLYVAGGAEFVDGIFHNGACFY